MIAAHRGLVLLLLASACDRGTGSDAPPSPPAVEAATPAPAPTPGPPPFRATAIATGGRSSYALMSDGTVRGWGNARSFALGRADTDLIASPIAIAGVDRATAIAAGGERGAKACAIRDDASVVCWGERDGFPMKLPDGVAGVAPTEIPALAGAREITLGSAAGCARMGDGTVKCWGKLSAWADKYTEPKHVTQLADVVAVRASGAHVCALAKAGAVWCWGSNRWGAVATLDGASGSRGTPTRAEDLPAAVELGVSDRMSCSRHADDTMRCWGTGTLRAVTLDRKPIALAHAGTAQHLCVVVEGGGLRCMGASGQGRLGVEPSTVTDAGQIVTVPGLPVVTAAATAPTHTCALADDGEVWCWGGNDFGQLGDGTANDRAAPKAVAQLRDRELALPVPVAIADAGPIERFDDLPEGCRAGSLTMSSTMLPRPRFDVKSAYASVEREVIWVHLRDHGFGTKGFAYEQPRGSGLHLELVFSRKKVTERRIRNPEPWQEGETESVERTQPVTLGTYVTFAAWLAMDAPDDQRKVELKLTASDGPILIESSPVRDGDLQQVELTRIGPDWVCGTITVAGARGQLAGDFAARVRK